MTVPRSDETAAGEATKLTAAGRVLALLGAFATSGGRLTLSEISRQAGLSLTTTHRLVQEVLAWGGLEVDECGKYRLGPKIIELASSSTEGLRLRERALPHLIDLHRRTGMTVHLAVRDDAELLYIEALRGHPNYTGENRIGGRLPLHVGGTGLTLLAFAPNDVVDAYLRRPLRRYTRQTVVEPERLRGVLADIRRQRYCLTRSLLTPRAGSLAAPIVSPDGDVIAAIGVVCLLDRHEPEQYLELVRGTAARASHALLSRPAPMSAYTQEFHRRHALGR